MDRDRIRVLHFTRVINRNDFIDTVIRLELGGSRVLVPEEKLDHVQRDTPVSELISFNLPSVV